VDPAEQLADEHLTASFPELRELGFALGSTSAVLDGEMVSLDDEGRPSFGRLQQRLHLGSASAVQRRAREFPANLLLFDVCYLDGRSTMALPYDERRRLLEGLKLQGEHFATPPSITDTPGAELLRVSRARPRRARGQAA
jgi:bifunctional non-homologous end joining protein LigD